MAKDPYIIPPSVRNDALARACRKGEIISPYYLETVINEVFRVIELHLKRQQHITKVLKEVGGFPVEWTGEDCFKWQ